jgi:hypothetical protein
MDYTVKDSGQREQFDGGMVRDTSAGKSRPDLVRDGPMFQRWVNHLTKGAVKYDARNWMKAKGEDEYNRALESLDRHYNIYYTYMRYGLNIEDPNNPKFDTPLAEDHAAAIFFNINLVEYVLERCMDELANEEDRVTEPEPLPSPCSQERQGLGGQPACHWQTSVEQPELTGDSKR